MNIYLIERTGRTYHDEAKGFVIMAETGLRARQIAAANCGDEGDKPWKYADITVIGSGQSEVEKVILRDYLHG